MFLKYIKEIQHKFPHKYNNDHLQVTYLYLLFLLCFIISNWFLKGINLNWITNSLKLTSLIKL